MPDPVITDQIEVKKRRGKRILSEDELRSFVRRIRAVVYVAAICSTVVRYAA
jgi:hypothetical protein